MASQQSRKDNVTEERKVHVEKDRVPKMATHFETLAGQVTGSDVPGGPSATVATVTVGGGQAGQGQKGIHSSTTATKHDQSHADRARGPQTATVGGGHATTTTGSGQAGQGQKGVHSSTTAAKHGQSYADRARGAETATIAGGQAGQGQKGAEKEAETGGGKTREVGKFQVRGKQEEEKGGTIGERRESAQRGSQTGAKHSGGIAFDVHGGEKGAKGGQEQLRQSQTGGKMGGGVGKFEVHGEAQKGSSGARRETHQPQAQPTSHAQGQEQLSLEEISKLRQTAQQNSAEAIHGAQERYAKEKHSGGGAAGRTKGVSGGEMGGSTFQNVAETTTQGVQKTTQYMAEKGGVVKDTALEKGQQGYVATKDTLSSAGQTAAQYTSQVAQKTKETVSPVVSRAKETVAPVVSKAKDVTLDTAKKVGSYAGQTAVAAKDVAVSTGATAAGYAGGVAVGVKDRAVVAGWGAAQMTAGAAAEATKAAANVTKGVVGYAADTAVAAKDVVANVGQKAVQYTGDTVAQVKDTVVHAEESAKEYAARKRAEAERDLEAKRSPSKVTGDYGSQIGEGREGKISQIGGRREGKIRGEDQAKQALQQAVEIQVEGGQQLLERGGVAVEAAGETLYEIARTPVEAAAKASPQKQQGMEGEGGVLQAVGETLVEIAQTATGLVSGGGGGGGVVQEKRGQEQGRQ